MKFALLCCPNLRIFNGQKVSRACTSVLLLNRLVIRWQVTDADVIAASEWGSGSARGRSVNCLIEVQRAHIVLQTL